MVCLSDHSHLFSQHLNIKRKKSSKSRACILPLVASAENTQNAHTVPWSGKFVWCCLRTHLRRESAAFSSTRAKRQSVNNVVVVIVHFLKTKSVLVLFSSPALHNDFAATHSRKTPRAKHAVEESLVAYKKGEKGFLFVDLYFNFMSSFSFCSLVFYLIVAYGFCCNILQNQTSKKGQTCHFQMPQLGKGRTFEKQAYYSYFPSGKAQKEKNLHDWRDAVEIRSRKRRESLINRFLPVSKGRGGGHGGLICQKSGGKTNFRARIALRDKTRSAIWHLNLTLKIFGK